MPFEVREFYSKDTGIRLNPAGFSLFILQFSPFYLFLFSCSIYSNLLNIHFNQI
jgi:hypothetical protein